MGSGYSLDQSAKLSADQSASGRGQTANDNSGFHSSIITYSAGGDLSASTTSTGGAIGQAMSDLPAWAWIAGGVVAVVVAWFYFRKKKK